MEFSVPACHLCHTSWLQSLKEKKRKPFMYLYFSYEPCGSRCTAVIDNPLPLNPHSCVTAVKTHLRVLGLLLAGVTPLRFPAEKYKLTIQCIEGRK